MGVRTGQEQAGSTGMRRWINEPVAGKAVDHVGPETRGGQFPLIAVTRCPDAVRGIQGIVTLG